MVPTTQKPNPRYYALRLQNMVTKEILWMNKTTKIEKLISHIWNSACPNTECPQQKSQSQSMQTPAAQSVNDKLSVWRPELRIRYLPNSIKDLYNEDKITCYFYFDQVLWAFLFWLLFLNFFLIRLSKNSYNRIRAALTLKAPYSCAV